MTIRTKKIAGFLIAVFALTAVFLTIHAPTVSADAGTLIESGITTAAGSNYEDISLGTFAGNLISALLAATGIIFIVMTVYAGIMYMTAGGAEDKVKKAKSILITSLIGIVIIVGAYAFTTFVVGELQTAATTAPAQQANP